MASTPKKNANKAGSSNDPLRFAGGGVGFKAKIIGVDDVAEPRGDKMCQESLQKLKAVVKVSGEHKQRIVINVSLEGLKLMDEKTGAILHQHAVHKISFIARDATDSRAFGYIYGPGDGSHQFFGIKTEKAAEGLVLTLRDLFQVVFEMKKKEIEEAKKLKEEGQDNKENEKNEENKDRTASQSNEDQEEPPVDLPECALEDLLGLESELRTLQQGIQQMDASGSQPTSMAPTTQQAFPSTAAAHPPTSLPAFGSPSRPQQTTTTWATFDSPSPQQSTAQPVPPQSRPVPTAAPVGDPFNLGQFNPPTSTAADKYAAFGQASPFGSPGVFGQSTGVAHSSPSTSGAVINDAYVMSPMQPSHPVQIPGPVAARDPFGELVNVMGGHPSPDRFARPPNKQDFVKTPPKPTLAELSHTQQQQQQQMQQQWQQQRQQLQPQQPQTTDPFGAPVSPCSEPVLGDKAVDPFDTSLVRRQPCPFPLQQSQPQPPAPKQPTHYFPTTFTPDTEEPPCPVAPPPQLPAPPLPAVFAKDVPPTPPPRSRDKDSPAHRPRPRGSLARAATIDVGHVGSPPPIPQRPPQSNQPKMSPVFKQRFEDNFSNRSSPLSQSPKSLLHRQSTISSDGRGSDSPFNPTENAAEPSFFAELRVSLPEVSTLPPKPASSTARPRPRSSTSQPSGEKLSQQPSDPFAGVTISRTDKSRSKTRRHASNCSSSSSTGAAETSVSPVPRPRPRPRPRSRGMMESPRVSESAQSSPRVGAGRSPSACSIQSQGSFAADVESTRQDAISIHSSEFQADFTAPLPEADGSAECTATPSRCDSSAAQDPFANVDPFAEDPLKDPFELESPSDPFSKDLSKESQVSFRTRAVTVDSISEEVEEPCSRSRSAGEESTSSKVTCNLSTAFSETVSSTATDSSLFNSTNIILEDSSFASLSSRDRPPSSAQPTTEEESPAPSQEAGSQPAETIPQPTFDDLLGQFFKEQFPPSAPTPPAAPPPDANWQTFTPSNSFSENLSSASADFHSTPISASNGEVPRSAGQLKDAFGMDTAFSGDLFPPSDQFSAKPFVPRGGANVNPFA